MLKSGWEYFRRSAVYLFFFSDREAMATLTEQQGLFCWLSQCAMLEPSAASAAVWKPDSTLVIFWLLTN